MFKVTAFASPAEAYARLALALTEVRKYLIPDGNDEIRQRQMKEIQILKKMQDKQEERTEDSGQESDVSASPTSEPSPVMHSSPNTSPPPPENQSLSPHSDKNGKIYDPRSKSILERIRHKRDSGEDRELIRDADLHVGIATKSILDRILPGHAKDRQKRDLEISVDRDGYDQPVWKKMK